MRGVSPLAKSSETAEEIIFSMETQVSLDLHIFSIVEEHRAGCANGSRDHIDEHIARLTRRSARERGREEKWFPDRPGEARLPVHSESPNERSKGNLDVTTVTHCGYRSERRAE